MNTALTIPDLGRGRFHLGMNVEYSLKGADGKAKRLFSENKLGDALLKLFREITPNPIDARGQVKEGLLNYLSAYGLRIEGITGSWGYKKKHSNLITNAGFAGVASRLNGSGGEAAFTYIAVGIGTTAANVADTTLESEIVDSGLARFNSTASRVTTDVTNDSARLTTTFTVSGTKAVTESGVLNAGAAGVLLARRVFSAVNVISGDSLSVTWTFDID